MKVLITGANGFLGSHLTRAMFRQGYDLRILVRRTANLNAVSEIPCETYFGNINNREDVFKAVRGCQIVIHVAATTRQWGLPLEVYEQINFVATKYIAEACLTEGVQKLVFVSTANTMAPGSSKKPGSEIGSFTLFESNSPYIMTKYMAQQLILEQVQQNGLPAVIVNPTFIIGPDNLQSSSGKIFAYALEKKIVLYPPGGKNFVCVQDVCNGITSALSKGKVGECYLLAGENLSYEQFFKMARSLSNRSRILIRIPASLLRVAGMAGTLLGKLTGKVYPMNYANAYLLCTENYYSAKKSKKELGIDYTSISEVIKDSVDRYYESKHLE